MNRWRNEKLCTGFDTKLMMMTDHTGTHVDAQTTYIGGKLGFPPQNSINNGNDFFASRFCKSKNQKQAMKNKHNKFPL